MNDKKRGLITKAISLLNEASSLVDGVLSDEQDCLDNVPDNLIDSERAQKFEDAVDNLEGALDGIDSAIESLNNAI